MDSRHDDRRSPESLVAAVYEIISGPAERERDWERFRGLFHSGARFVIHASSDLGESGRHGVWDVEGFVDAAAEEYRADGFWEREIRSRKEQWGSIAHLWSTYETRTGAPDAEPIGRGINSVQCVRLDDGWRIAHLVFDIESPDNPIPDRYLPGGSAPSSGEDRG